MYKGGLGWRRDGGCGFGGIVYEVGSVVEKGSSAHLYQKEYEIQMESESSASMTRPWTILPPRSKK